MMTAANTTTTIPITNSVPPIELIPNHPEGAWLEMLASNKAGSGDGVALGEREAVWVAELD
jgi:hypothetical protein